ncbi:MAG: phosphopantothenoylcysteine decarboxylase [Leptospiraceae bacterium]|nr:phosphopantothenoylcysteine decarboxylase [Leptospiraceae bacterium]MDW8305789.1 flavoprotein [Leptospiraceae bacterium]
MKKGSILLGVSASIAIYRSCELVRELTKRGYLVRVLMTRTAEKWIHPVLFEALSGQRVYTEKDSESGMPHIELRRDISLYLIAPATADLIARAAQGRADDIVTATLLSFPGERWLAPAMNPYMYSHKATQRNLTILREYGYRILEPQSGMAVCGDEGLGKMAEIEDILLQIEKFFSGEKSSPEN